MTGVIPWVVQIDDYRRGDVAEDKRAVPSPSPNCRPPTGWPLSVRQSRFVPKYLESTVFAMTGGSDTLYNPHILVPAHRRRPRTVTSDPTTLRT
jgi:hypothetical protein